MVGDRVQVFATWEKFGGCGPGAADDEGGEPDAVEELLGRGRQAEAFDLNGVGPGGIAQCVIKIDGQANGARSGEARAHGPSRVPPSSPRGAAAGSDPSWPRPATGPAGRGGPASGGADRPVTRASPPRAGASPPPTCRTIQRLKPPGQSPRTSPRLPALSPPPAAWPYVHHQQAAVMGHSKVWDMLHSAARHCEPKCEGLGQHFPGQRPPTPPN